MTDSQTLGFVGVLLAALCLSAWGQYPDQVLLKDVQVLTLRQGYMTNGRRSSPVPQLKCVGGTAGCHKFIPQVVQCYNRGSDGIDVQWECKTDMDNAYRFGKTDVTCEGYTYPDDPYILKGSCGMEYTIDLTKEGYDQQQNRHTGGSGYYSKQHTGESKSWGGAVVIIVVVIAYIVYKNFLATPSQPADQPYPPNDRHPYGPPPPYSAPRDDNNSPPSPGFKPEHTGGATAGGWTGGASGSGASYRGAHGGTTSGQYFGSSTHTTAPPDPNAGGAGGFWTGAATGGLLGYLFGSSTRGANHGGHYQQPYPTGGWGGAGWNNPSGSSGWFSGSSSSSFSSGSSGSSGSSTGTRTASGFGGTTRR